MTALFRISFLCVGLTLLHLTSCDTFNEQVLLRPLSNKLVHANFKFMTSTSPNSLVHGHYELFPKMLGEVLVKYNVQEMELSLTQGNWRYSQWGLPVEGSANPSGASILVLFNTNTVDIDKQWKGLVNALSGLVCASLNFIDESVTTHPRYTFYPRGAFPSDQVFNHSMLRYANLPQENVCTENLTPWKKLMPCVGRAGLSSLLNPEPLYDSHYHSLSISVRPECTSDACTSSHLVLTQSLSVVLSHSKFDHFTIKSLFRRSVPRSCHVAQSSQVIVQHAVDGPTALTLDPVADKQLDRQGHITSTYTSVVGLNVKATYKTQPKYQQLSPPVLHFQRYLTGYGQEYGSIICEISNNQLENVQIVYTEYVPWYLRLYLHTLKVQSEDRSIKPSKMFYSPGLERKKPYLIELLLTVPANATTVISFEVEKLFLKWTEYNPDASLGFYTPSAIITAVLADAPQDAAIEMLKEDYGVVRMYTEKLLVLLPTPDFSMPYNVICLACTIVALAFGSFHNITTKTLVRETEPPQSLLTRVKKLLGMRVEEKPAIKDGEEAETDNESDEEGTVDEK